MKTEAQKLCEALLLEKIKECERLYEVNHQLVEALQWALNQIEDDLDPDHQDALDQARATITKATGESK